MELRHACMMDKEEIYTLMCETYHTTFDKEIFERILWEGINTASAYYIVAVEHEEVVGFASLSLEKALHCLGTFAKIQEFTIMQKSNPEAVAKELMDVLFSKAEHLNCMFVEIQAVGDSMIYLTDLLTPNLKVKQMVYHIPL